MRSQVVGLTVVNRMWVQKENMTCTLSFYLFCGQGTNTFTDCVEDCQCLAVLEMEMKSSLSFQPSPTLLLRVQHHKRSLSSFKGHCGSWGSIHQNSPVKIFRVNRSVYISVLTAAFLSQLLLFVMVFLSVSKDFWIIVPSLVVLMLLHRL